MKKVTLFVIFAVLSLMKTEAQDYLISFTATGAVTFIDSVTVDNLTDRTSVTLGGGDTLHLTLGVGINLPELNHGVLRIYPNPLTKESTMIFTSPETGIGAIRIVDLSGKTIYQTSKLLSAGKHTFSISGISRGIYFVKVDGEGYNYSAKLISVGNYPGDVRIDYVSSGKINPGNPLKSTAATIDMPYTNGDLLLFNGISGIYSTILTDVPASSKSITFQFADCTDADNNNYSIVQIGAQTWMAENLNVGMRIDGSQEQTNNGIFEKYCYDNNENYCNIYGGLYQWHEMMQYVTAEGVQGICPTGWHLPADGEWAILTAYLQGEAVAGGKMKSTGSIEAGTGLWQTPNTGATNETGFTAIPGGYCDNGSFASIGGGGNWWSSSENSWNAVWSRYLTYFSNSMYRPSSGESFGYSVRCLKNASNVNTILNVPGSYQEWNPADSTTIITSLNADEKYEGYLWFPANTAYKYAKGSWALSWGDTGADGTLETDGNNILAGAAGYYKLNADLLSLTHSFLRTSWGVIGSSTPGGWDSETEMTFDTITEVWSVTMNLTAGEMLFRANHSWELSYGDNDANGTLEQGGANIAVTIPGNYTITMDLSKAVYNYQLTNNSLFTCGSSLTINHVTGNVAPVDKTVSYGTVNNIPGEPSKCWITSNLGADHQATARNDESEASAGWYWQFNRKQGYKHDGTTRTPNTVWIDLIDENLEWQALNDPCARELGNSWRIPTTTEWANVDAAGNWTNWNGPWNSDLKLHAAGFVGIPNGTLYSRGFAGDNWSSSRSNAQFGWALYFHSGTCEMTPNFKSNAFSLRCLRETGTSEIPAVTTGV
ncbi:MAG: FISUMP domain-containing protein, partial [Bacteroidota bacterium]